MSIEVRIKDDELNYRVWKFYMLRDMEFILNTYEEHRKETKRHKFKVVARYERIGGRNNTLERKDVYVPQTVIKMATDKIIDRITFTTN